MSKSSKYTHEELVAMQRPPMSSRCSPVPSYFAPETAFHNTVLCVELVYEQTIKSMRKSGSTPEEIRVFVTNKVLETSEQIHGASYHIRNEYKRLSDAAVKNHTAIIDNIAKNMFTS